MFDFQSWLDGVYMSYKSRTTSSKDKFTVSKRKTNIALKAEEYDTHILDDSQDFC